MRLKKIFNKEELVSLIKSLREDNKSIVFGNGCFDILHIGHIRYLQAAALLGDILIIGINSDLSVRSLKGENRPLLDEYNRLRLVSSLSCVNFVIVFDDKTADSLIDIIKPDFYCKGGDYTVEELPESIKVKEYGGQVIIVGGEKIKSTTSIIKERILVNE